MSKRKFRWLVVLLVAVPLVGVGGFMGYQWWQERRAEYLDEAVTAVRIMGGSIEYERNNVSLPALGVKLVGVGGVNPERMKLLSRFTQLKALNLAGSNVTNEMLEPLKDLGTLEELYLGTTSVSDPGVKHLRPLMKLRTLSLADTEVTDGCLDDVATLVELRWLDLGSTSVTDSGLQKLRGLSKLEWLGLQGATTTEAGRAELRKALPGAQIVP